MKRLLFGATLCSTLGIAGLLAVLAAPTPCMDSTLVKNLSILSRGSDERALPATLEVQRCGIPAFPSGWGRDEVDTANLVVKRITLWDMLAQWAPPRFHGIRVQVDLNKTNYIFFSRDELRVGADALEVPGRFDRALVMAFLKANELGGAADFEREITADLLVAIQRGPVIEIDSSTGSTLNLEVLVRPWFLQALSFGDYCRSAFRSLLHVSYCASQNRARATPELIKSFTTLSLRPALSAFLWQYAQELGWRERTRFFRALLNPQMTGVDAHLPVFPAESDFLALETRLELFLRAFIQRRVNGVDENSFNKLAASLFVRGEYNADIMVVSEEPVSAWADLVNLREVIDRHPEKRVVLVLGSEWHFLPAVAPLPFQPPPRLKARQVILAGCPKAVSGADLLKYREVTDRVAVVRTCTKSPRVNWHSLLTAGVGQGIHESRLVAFRLRPLTLAQRHRGPGPNDLFNADALGSWLDWRELRWDARSSGYRPLATYEAVELVKEEP